MVESIVGSTFLVKDESGKLVETTFQKQKDQGVQVWGLYYSAHWCPPCRGFTPKLADFYKQVNANGKKLEIIFVSCDDSDKSMEEYFESMPFIAVPFNDKRKDDLANKFGVSGIPDLTILKSDGTVATKDGRAHVMSKGKAAFDDWLNMLN